MSDDIKFILSKFPDHRNRILSEYLTNDEFKGLVEDFYSAAMALDNYDKKMRTDTRNELEYRNVFRDLEKEIIQFLYRDSEQ